MPHPDPAREAAQRARQVAFARFNELCCAAHRLLSEASQLAIQSGLAEVHQRKAEAASALAGATFYSAPPCADAVDFQRLRDDLELIRDKIDPLIAAIGDDAYSSAHCARRSEFDDCFKNVIGIAIDGNALHLLDRAAEDAAEAAHEPDPDHQRDLRRDDAMMGV
jgi:hypothetical protein